MNIINTTPHAINIVDDDKNVVKAIAPSGYSIRLEQSQEVIGSVDGIPVSKTVYGDAYLQGPDGKKMDLPEQRDDTIYIVSGLIAAGLDRGDLVVPAGQVRDDEGKVIGCTGLGIVDDKFNMSHLERNEEAVNDTEKS